MKKRLPGLIWLTIVALYALKRFGPDDPLAWARSMVGRGGALVGEDPLVATEVQNAVSLSADDGQLSEAVAIGTSVLGDRSLAPS
jgi:hypothetical protein